MAKKKSDPCPCGSGKQYDLCCGLYIEQRERAPTAEILMRSRYTAYVLRDVAYLLATWHPRTRPAALDLDAGTKWVGLEVKRHEQDDTHAVVEFSARYKINGKAGKLHETSRFARAGEAWLYLDGEIG